MITMHTFHRTHAPGAFLRRWHHQHRWRMEHQMTRRMQSNTHRWYALHQRAKRENAELSRFRKKIATPYLRHIRMAHYLDNAIHGFDTR